MGKRCTDYRVYHGTVRYGRLYLGIIIPSSDRLAQAETYGADPQAHAGADDAPGASTEGMYMLPSLSPSVLSPFPPAVGHVRTVGRGGKERHRRERERGA